jgi:ankyrin repeat protein
MLANNSFLIRTAPNKLVPFPESLIYDALIAESEDSVKLLLDCGVDINGKGENSYPALELAVRYSRLWSFIPMLLDNGADPALSAGNENLLSLAKTIGVDQQFIDVLASHMRPQSSESS